VVALGLVLWNPRVTAAVAARLLRLLLLLTPLPTAEDEQIDTAAFRRN